MKRMKKFAAAAQKDYKKKKIHEISLSLYDPSILGLYAMDDYPSFSNELVIRDKVVYIKDDMLFSAINRLKDLKKYIVILSYWEDMNDREISEILHIPQRTIQYNRASAIVELKKNLNIKKENSK